MQVPGIKSTLTAMLFAGSLFAENLTISGRVMSEGNREPLEFATLVVKEANFKTRIQPNGNYVVPVPAPGDYTLQIISPGFADFVEKIRVQKSVQRDVVMQLPLIPAPTVKIRSERDIQNLSRNTLTTEQLKETPAALGDSINALATLPGVLRPDGFFGPLIVRGAGDKANRYFIDDIPIMNPQHFGGFQSIISNDLMREVDLYSSAFPSAFGGALGAIIDIKTIDEVQKFGGVVDVSLISANFLFKNSWGTNADGNLTITTETKTSPGSADQVNPPMAGKRQTSPTGYWITSGRIGYLTLLVPPIYEVLTGKQISRLPEYYDYQLKGKLFLDDAGKHSLTSLFFGSYDTFRVTRSLTSQEKAEKRSAGEDPLLANLKISNDVSTHSQGLYYDYVRSSRLSNRVLAFSSINYSSFYFDLDQTAAPGTGVTDLRVHPNIFGLKNKFSLDWAEFSSLRLALEYNLFHFKSNGQTQQFTGSLAEEGVWDLGNPQLTQIVPVNFENQNHVLSAYLENRLNLGRLRIVPGLRTDYLDRARIATADPRGVISYEFPSETTLSFAMGQYQSFAQTNTFYFNQIFNYQPQVVVADYLRPERAIHRTAGIEQKLNLLTLKVEGFVNDFDRLLESSAAATGRYFSNSGELKAKGVEILLRKDSTEKDHEFYGWVSYTYTQGERRRQGNWGRFEYEQPHALKLVAGYRFGANTISSQFQLYSGFPYTAITGSACSQGYDCSNSETSRYSPIYDSNLYSARYTLSHRLDIRYTRKTAYKWGYFSWYIEIINIYNYAPANSQIWVYNQPFSAANPRIAVADGTLTLIPYFGLEWRF